MRAAARLVAAVVVASAPAACRTSTTLVTPDPHLERMLKQEKDMPYASDPLRPRGMAMQRPPDDTLPVGTLVGEPLVTTGVAGGRYADRIPIRVDHALVWGGKRDFDTFCAACHGILGDGDSAVAAKMALRKPVDLQQGYVRAYPPGRIFQDIREGYGLMPSYAVQLSIERSWGVVAYLRALQLARGARVASLPAGVQAELRREVP